MEARNLDTPNSDGVEEEVKCGSVVAGRNSIVEVAVVEETAYMTPLPSFFSNKILHSQITLFY